MALRINDMIPNLSAETDQGIIHLHTWVGDGWAVIVSLPDDFTLVGTSEIGAVAQLDAEWKKRNVKVLGVTVDGAEDQEKWKSEIQIARRAGATFSIATDKDHEISKAFDMLPAEDHLPEGRTLNDIVTSRTVDVIGPDKKLKLSMAYPMTVGRNFNEILRAVDALQTSAGKGVTTPNDWTPGDDIIIPAR